jgi:uncharacterized protein
VQWYTVESLGPNRHLMPSGALVCTAVPVARIGQQIYGPGETPIDTDDSGMVRIERAPEEVFRDETMASLRGCPVVIDHPLDAFGDRTDVTPDNWRQLAVGHTENPRRGDGALADFLVADLVIHDRGAIDLINTHGKRQISLGYSADYDELGPGHGRQRNILINHVAAVDTARCGPMCAIGDADSQAQSQQEAKMPRTSWADRLRKAIKARDQEIEKALDEAAEGEGTGEGEGEGEGGNTEHHIHVHVASPKENGEAQGGDQEENENVITIAPEEIEELWAANQAETEALQRLGQAVGGGADSIRFRDSWPHRDARRKKMGLRIRDQEKEDEDKDKDKDADEGATFASNKSVNREFELEAPPGARTGDIARVRDSAFMADSFAETASYAEALVPGIHLPVFDSAAPKERTYDAICQFRRQVLDLAYVQPDGRALIDDIERGFTSARQLPCARVRQIFREAGRTMKAVNNGRMTGARSADLSAGFGGAVLTAQTRDLAAYQKQLDEFYAEQK